MDEYINAVQQQIAQNNAWSAEQAQKQMEFQERMSNTAHQREIADLKAAGLNPVLSARLGGASTPSGAMANVDNSGTSAFAQILTKVLDIQNENAKAIQTMAGIASSSSGSARTEANKDRVNDVNGILGLIGQGLPSDAKKLATSLYDAADKIAEKAGYSEDSNVRRYLSGDWSLQDTINVVKNAVSNFADKVTASINKGSSNIANSYVNVLKDSYDQRAKKLETVSNKVVSAVKSVLNKFKK